MCVRNACNMRITMTTGRNVRIASQRMLDDLFLLLIIWLTFIFHEHFSLAIDTVITPSIEVPSLAIAPLCRHFQHSACWTASIPIRFQSIYWHPNRMIKRFVFVSKILFYSRVVNKANGFIWKTVLIAASIDRPIHSTNWIRGKIMCHPQSGIEFTVNCLFCFVFLCLFAGH